MELKSDFENTPRQQQQQQQQEEDQGDEKLEKHQQQKQKQKHVFHVLAVDDSIIDRKLLEKLFRVSSCKVTCVDSGDKALEYLGLLDNLENNSTASAFSSPYTSQQEGVRVNLIMTDFCMPGMSGYDLLKRVKGSSWKDVPVVVMSSENVPSRISMCLEGGAEDFLLKPLRLSDLDKLEDHLLKSLNQNMDDNHEFNPDPGNNESRINNYENFNTTGNNENTRSNESSSSSSSSNSNSNSNFKSNNNSGFSKRKKALVAETEERRPKMKELAVV